MGLGEIRRAQVVSTYGPGALIPIEEESFMVAGTDFWFDRGEPDASDTIHEARLESHLGVQGFVLPPSGDKDSSRDIPVTRFPKWYSCASCNSLMPYHKIADVDGKCSVNACGGRLVTSRFIAICDSGHVGDFPYLRWAHQGSEGEGTHNLKLINEGRSAGLSDIVVQCSCGSKRSLQGALGKNALQGVSKCFGDRPWLPSPSAETCEKLPRGVQRGASNVWQGVTASSISIPPWSSEANRFIDNHWNVLENIPESALEITLGNMLVRFPLPGGLEEAMAAVGNRRRLADGQPLDDKTMRKQEYEALRRITKEGVPDQDFICRQLPESETLPNGISRVNLITRLREVRALKGFYRLSSGQGGDLVLAPLSASRKWWLPAIEVSGEGIFLEFDIDKVKAWETDPLVIARAGVLAAARVSNPITEDIPVPSPRWLLVHTLAHVLIDQWSLECGYPAASLRERIYVDEEMAGILVYTATSDSQGSLGGIVGMAKGGRLIKSFTEAISRTSWCSNDPLCIESGPNGFANTNLGACHACVLLAETSCEIRNSVLDRGMLVGVANGVSGYFSDESPEK